MHSPSIQALIDHLRSLPGVGPKSAQRMAFHMLQHNRHGANDLADALKAAMRDVRHCESCRTFCETERCKLCSSSQRDPERLCVVESPVDVWAIEETGHFRGQYFVLHGQLSPLDGLGPNELALPQLFERLRSSTELNEVILATSATLEGEATAFYISEQCDRLHLACSRLALGMPQGSHLEYLDGHTVARALSARTPFKASASSPL